VDTQSIQPIQSLVKVQQFYYTYCLPGRSVSGLARWQIRALSPSLPEGKAIDFSGQACSLDFSRLQIGFASKQDQLVLVRLQENAVLARTGYVGNISDREASFTHALVLPRQFDAFKAISTWGGSWTARDGDFSAQLPELEESQIPLGNVLNDQAATRYLTEAVTETARKRMQWASQVISASLSLLKGEHRRLYIFANPDEIVTLMYIALRCLPGIARREMTFSTHEEDLEASLDVKMIGCALKPNRKNSVPSSLFYGSTLGINTYADTQTGSQWPISPYAERAASWIQAGNWAAIDGLLEKINSLDRPADSSAPAVAYDDIDVLFRLEGDKFDETDPEKSRMGVALSSPAIFGNLLCDAKEIRNLISLVFQNEPFYTKTVEAVSGWFPKDRQSVEICKTAFVENAMLYLSLGSDVERIEAIGELFCHLTREVPAAFHQKLLEACFEASKPTVNNQFSLDWLVWMGLFRIWQATPECKNLSNYTSLGRIWLQPNADQVREIILTEECRELQQFVIENYLTSIRKLVEIPPSVFKALVDSKQPNLAKSFFVHTVWREILSRENVPMNHPDFLSFLQIVSNSLGLADATDGQMIAIVKAWSKSNQGNLMPDKIPAILSVAECLQTPDKITLVLDGFYDLSERKHFTAKAAECITGRCNKLEAFQYLVDKLAPVVASSRMDFIRACAAECERGNCNPNIAAVTGILGKIADSFESASGQDGAGLDLPQNREQLSTIASICLRYFPGHFLVSTPGSNLLEKLVLDPSLAQQHAQRIQSLKEIRDALNARVLEHNNIETLSKAYAGISNAEDQPLREKIHKKLIELVVRQPQTTHFIILNFIGNVRNPQALIHFMEMLLDEITKMGNTNHGNIAIDIFLRFCAKGITEPTMLDFVKLNENLSSEWIAGLGSRLGRKNRRAILWSVLTSSNWSEVNRQEFFSKFKHPPDLTLRTIAFFKRNAKAIIMISLIIVVLAVVAYFLRLALEVILPAVQTFFGKNS